MIPLFDASRNEKKNKNKILHNNCFSSDHTLKAVKIAAYDKVYLYWLTWTFSSNSSLGQAFVSRYLMKLHQIVTAIFMA